jgi:hypothetical protein
VCDVRDYEKHLRELDQKFGNPSQDGGNEEESEVGGKRNRKLVKEGRQRRGRTKERRMTRKL